MAKMKWGVRSPTAHRTKEQAQKHGRKRTKANPTGQTPAAIERRGKNNAAAKKMGNPKGDVAHKKSLRSGGTNARSNLTVQSPKKNRGHGRTRGAKPNSNKGR